MEIQRTLTYDKEKTAEIKVEFSKDTKGELDIKITEGMETHSKVEKEKKILKKIEYLDKEYGEATPDAILEEMKNEGIDTDMDEVEELLKKLKKVGDVYTPKHGVYKTAD